MREQLYTIEHPDEGVGHDHTERKLERIKTEETDRYKSLHEAQASLLNNESLYNSRVTGLLRGPGFTTNGSAVAENAFISYCQNLTDEDVANLVMQFNRGLAEYIRKNNVRLGISSADLQGLLSPQQNEFHARLWIEPKGILNVIEFIRARKMVHGVGEQQNFEFFFNDALDSSKDIDLLEVIYDEGGSTIQTLNLIQAKSSRPSQEKINENVAAHRRWVTESVMDFDAFTREFTDGIPDGVTIESLAENAEQVEELLLDMCTDPEGFNPDSFLEKLDLGTLTNKQKAWLLLKYGKIIEEKISKAKEDGILDEQQASQILEALNKLTNKVTAKAKLPKNFAKVGRINSLITVGPNVINEVTILGPETADEKKKVFKIA